jgi:hypothetical protein
MHERNAVSRSNGSHQTFAISDYLVSDGDLQGTGIDTDLLSRQCLKGDGSFPKVLANISRRR